MGGQVSVLEDAPILPSGDSATWWQAYPLVELGWSGISSNVHTVEKSQLGNTATRSLVSTVNTETLEMTVMTVLTGFRTLHCTSPILTKCTQLGYKAVWTLKFKTKYELPVWLMISSNASKVAFIPITCICLVLQIVFMSDAFGSRYLSMHLVLKIITFCPPPPKFPNISLQRN